MANILQPGISHQEVYQFETGIFKKDWVIMTGQTLKLCADLKEIFDLAMAEEFSDFNNRQFATPKVELVKRLMIIVNNVKEGIYDEI